MGNSGKVTRLEKDLRKIISAKGKRRDWRLVGTGGDRVARGRPLPKFKELMVVRTWVAVKEILGYRRARNGC